jgi:hypothetical protein
LFRFVPESTVAPYVTVDEVSNIFSCILIKISLICDKSVTTKNLAFLIYWYKKKRLQMHFNKYIVITQFAKLAAGEQLCRRCTHRKL